MPFEPGVSGNPNGRPRKGQSIQDKLEAELEKLILETSDGPIDGKTLVAKKWIRLALYEYFKDKDGKPLKVDPDLSFRALESIVNRLDGMPAQAVNFGSQSRPLMIGFMPMTAEDFAKQDNVEIHGGEGNRALLSAEEEPKKEEDGNGNGKRPFEGLNPGEGGTGT